MLQVNTLCSHSDCDTDKIIVTLKPKQCGCDILEAVEFLELSAVELLELSAVEFFELLFVELYGLSVVLKWGKFQSVDIPLMSDLHDCLMMFI